MLGVFAIVFPASHQTEECLVLRELLDTLLARWRKPGFIVYASCQLALLRALCATVRSHSGASDACASRDLVVGRRPAGDALPLRARAVCAACGLSALHRAGGHVDRALEVKYAGELSVLTDPSLLRAPATYYGLWAAESRQACLPEMGPPELYSVSSGTVSCGRVQRYRSWET